MRSSYGSRDGRRVGSISEGRSAGEEGLRPKPKGRPVKRASETAELTERLRPEVEYLRAQNPYLGK